MEVNKTRRVYPSRTNRIQIWTKEKQARHYTVMSNETQKGPHKPYRRVRCALEMEMEGEKTKRNGRAGIKKPDCCFLCVCTPRNKHTRPKKMEGVVGARETMCEDSKGPEPKQSWKKNTNKSWKIVTPSQVYFSKRINTKQTGWTVYSQAKPNWLDTQRSAADTFEMRVLDKRKWIKPTWDIMAFAKNMKGDKGF